MHPNAINISRCQTGSMLVSLLLVPQPLHSNPGSPRPTFKLRSKMPNMKTFAFKSSKASKDSVGRPAFQFSVFLLTFSPFPGPKCHKHFPMPNRFHVSQFAFGTSTVALKPKQPKAIKGPSSNSGPKCQIWRLLPLNLLKLRKIVSGVQLSNFLFSFSPFRLFPGPKCHKHFPMPNRFHVSLFALVPQPLQTTSRVAHTLSSWICKC